jgi:hypothetical protein
MKGRRPPSLSAVFAVALLAGCWQPRESSQVDIVIKRLQSDQEAEREEAFQDLVQGGREVAPRAKAAILFGKEPGFPLVAVLYVQGEGDAVPLELRVRHLAVFRWPGSRAVENGVLEPYVWNEIERDLLRTGRPALRLLARALEQESPTVAKALQVARVMLLVGGRAAAEEFAGLLDRTRALDGARVCDVAAAALLYLGSRELELRISDGDGLVRAAREWWGGAKDAPEPEWVRGAAIALADRWKPGDPEGVRPVLDLLAGRKVEDPKAWREREKNWSPAPPPLHPRELLPRLSGDRPSAYDANRRLEAATGVRLQGPRASTLEGFRAALRTWGPEPNLAAKWRRYLESARLRLTVVVIAHVPRRGANHVAAMHERHFHATEDETVTTGASGSEGQYLLHLQSREFGTRLVYNEYVAAGGEDRGVVAEFPSLRPVVVVSPLLKGCTVVLIEEVPVPQPPRSPEALFAALRARLKEAARESEGTERGSFLRALGYCQDRGDAEFLREQGAWEALLLLGDPAALPHRPRLEPYEVEMALRRAEDAGVKEYLESLRRGAAEAAR